MISQSMFCPKIKHDAPAILPKAEYIPETPNNQPVTRAKIKSDNKKIYLPGERLAIKLENQNIKTRKRNHTNDIDYDKVSNSFMRIIRELV